MATAEIPTYNDNDNGSPPSQSHSRSNASLINKYKTSSDLFGTPLFETLETTFADIDDSEDEFLDDDEVDDDDYEYNTDEDWKDEDEIDNDIDNGIISRAVTFAVGTNKAKAKPPNIPKPQQISLKAKSYGESLQDYKHFNIRSVTIYGNLFNRKRTIKVKKSSIKLKKYKRIKELDEDEVNEEEEEEEEQKDELLKREYIKTEIIETEKSYLKGLQCLLNEFIKPIFGQKMIPRKYEKEVTSIIPMIIKFHIEFLHELTCEYNKADAGNISSVFIKCAAFMKLYIDYIMKYQTILDIFGKHNKSKKLKKYLKKKRKERKPLTNHLILPIQRVPRYMLLLQDLKKNTPAKHKNYGTICRALDIVDRVAVSINERKREIENMSQCLQVMETLRELNRNIVEPHRKFLAQFLFLKKDNQRPRQFFVFSDLIIICNLKMKVKMILEMRTIELKKQNSSLSSTSGSATNTNDKMIISYINDAKDNEFTLYTAKGKPIEYETDMDKIDDIIELNELIIKSRLQVWDGDLSRLGSNDGKSKTRDALKKCGVSQAQQYRNQLETLQRLREKKDQSLMNVFRKSALIKGKKNKVLEMLGADQ